MSIPPVKTTTRQGRDPRHDDGRAVPESQAADFHAAMRRRQRPRGRRNDDDMAAAPPLWQLALALAAAAGPPTPDGDAMPSGKASCRVDTPPEATSPFPPGVDVQRRNDGAALHLRFTRGDWAGMELQAALQAGQIVVTLRPLTRQQHKRLIDAKASLCEQVGTETGEVIKLEIVNATR